MKKIILFSLSLLLAFIIYLGLEGRNTHEIRTEVEISAPPAKVWSILMDIDKWQDWNPVINKSSGTASIGSQLDITMRGKEEDKDGPNYQPTIIQLNEAKSLVWRATMVAGFIFTNGKFIELEEIESGTRLIHSETFSGVMAAMMKGKMEKGVPPILDEFNTALKEFAEKQ